MDDIRKVVHAFRSDATGVAEGGISRISGPPPSMAAKFR